MTVTRDKSSLVEILQHLLDELCAPDLTIDLANDLRSRLFRLLEEIHEFTRDGHSDGMETDFEPTLRVTMDRIPADYRSRPYRL